MVDFSMLRYGDEVLEAHLNVAHGSKLIDYSAWEYYVPTGIDDQLYSYAQFKECDMNRKVLENLPLFKSISLKAQATIRVYRSSSLFAFCNGTYVSLSCVLAPDLTSLPTAGIGFKYLPINTSGYETAESIYYPASNNKWEYNSGAELKNFLHKLNNTSYVNNIGFWNGYGVTNEIELEFVFQIMRLSENNVRLKAYVTRDGTNYALPNIATVSPADIAKIYMIYDQYVYYNADSEKLSIFIREATL